MKLPSLPGFDEHAFDKYLKNTGWLMFGKILNMIVGFAMARYLGKELFGDLNTAEALTVIAAAVGALGLDSFIVRELLNHPEKKDEILGTAIVMRAGVSLLIIPFTIIVYLLLHASADMPGTTLTSIVAVLAVAAFFKSFNIIDSYFQSQVQSRFVVRVQNSCLLLSSVLKIVLITLKTSLFYFALSYVFDAVILASGLLLMYRLKGNSISKWTFNKDRALSLIRQSWPLIISAVMVSLYMKIDALMLKSIRGSAEVGIYSAAARISESWYFIPVAIVTSIFPAIIHARKTDPPKYRRRLQNLYDLLVVISLPVALLISFSASSIMDLIYNGKFAGSGPMLSIHIWSGIFVFLGSASSQYLLAEGYTHISFIRTGIGAAVNIVLNIWLIPLYGGVGASVATLAAYFIATFSVLFFKRTREQGIDMLRSLFLISLAQSILSGREQRSK